jgi:hypothetical protein
LCFITYVEIYSSLFLRYVPLSTFVEIHRYSELVIFWSDTVLIVQVRRFCYDWLPLFSEALSICDTFYTHTNQQINLLQKVFTESQYLYTSFPLTQWSVKHMKGQVSLRNDGMIRTVTLFLLLFRVYPTARTGVYICMIYLSTLPAQINKPVG